MNIVHTILYFAELVTRKIVDSYSVSGVDILFIFILVLQCLWSRYIVHIYIGLPLDLRSGDLAKLIQQGNGNN